MDIKTKINEINCTALDQRINLCDDLLLIADYYLNSTDHQDILANNILDCILGMRSSRFIETDTDIKLLDVAMLIARTTSNKTKYLKPLLKEAIYYSNYSPQKYNKIELEREINALTAKNST